MTIRIARTDDADAIRAIYAPIVAATVISFELDVPTVDEMRRRIDDDARTLSVARQRGRRRRGGRLRLREPPSRARGLSMVGRRDRVRARRTGAAGASARRSTVGSATSSPRSAIARRSRRSRCRTRRASRCTSRSASRPSACTATSATSSVRGATSDGGSGGCGTRGCRRSRDRSPVDRGPVDRASPIVVARPVGAAGVRYGCHLVVRRASSPSNDGPAAGGSIPALRAGPLEGPFANSTVPAPTRRSTGIEPLERRTRCGGLDPRAARGAPRGALRGSTSFPSWSAATASAPASTSR